MPKVQKKSSTVAPPSTKSSPQSPPESERRVKAAEPAHLRNARSLRQNSESEGVALLERIAALEKLAMDRDVLVAAYEKEIRKHVAKAKEKLLHELPQDLSMMYEQAGRDNNDDLSNYHAVRSTALHVVEELYAIEDWLDGIARRLEEANGKAVTP